ncbi:MAG: zf-TFIIB domain-containing protein [Myxococcales bacterium]|nr:zf-TFIIB domain-containing protein [Myxococcales bacterium]
MNCPRCEQPTLVEIDRDGITIDRCERCRGVWLDRGELEKLVVRGRGGAVDAATTAPPTHPRALDRRRNDDDLDDDDDARRPRRRSGWWEIFD